MKYFILLLTLTFMLGTPAIAEEAAEKETPVENVENMYADLEIFANALTIVGAHYVEETTPKEIIYGSLKGMLSSLDPYSQFLDPEAYREIKVDTEGRFGGVGVEISFRDGILTVISPVDGTPAAKAGLAPGDKIVRINGESTRGLTLEDSVKLLRGKPGTTVEITVLREGEGRLIDFTIQRAIIKVQSIKEALVLRDQIGYIRISEFQENTPRDLRTALKDLESENIEGLILDLRNNPGGLLSVAIEVAEEFVPREKLIVYTKGRDADQETRFSSKGVEKARPYPIAVLINGGSASASEIVAGAMKDHRLGIVLGTKTFGKGSVQTVIPMRDGSAIRLTTAKYFTPSGNLIHGVGITPDIEVPYRRLEPHKRTAEEREKQKASEVFDRVDEISDLEDESAETQASQTREKSGDITADKELDNQILRAMDLMLALNVYEVKIDEGRK